MGYTLGVLVFGRDLRDEEEALLSIFAPMTSLRRAPGCTGEQALDADFPDLALAHLGDRTVLVDHDLPEEFTLEFDFLPPSPARQDLERLSRTVDVLCVHLQSTSGVYGHAFFSGGARQEAVYRSPDEWVVACADPDQEPDRDAYGEDWLFDRLDRFVGGDFRRRMRADDLELAVFRRA